MYWFPRIFRASLSVRSKQRMLVFFVCGHVAHMPSQPGQVLPWVCINSRNLFTACHPSSLQTCQRSFGQDSRQDRVWRWERWDNQIHCTDGCDGRPVQRFSHERVSPMHPLLSIQLSYFFTAERFLVPFCQSFLSRILMKLLHSSMIMIILWLCTSSRKTTHLNRKVRLLKHPFQLIPDLCNIFSFQEYTVRRCNCQWSRSSSWQYVLFFFFNKGST